MGKGPLTLGAYEGVTENIVIVGKKNTGKSYLGHVLVEELIRFNRQTRLMSGGIGVVILAPSGNWWGLRAGQRGSARGGNRVLTIGGEHADFPLNVQMGARVADLVDAVRPCPILIQMDALTVHGQQEFVADFSERLAMNQACRLLHVVFDEAEDFFPTFAVSGPQLRAARALDYLVRKRRTKGIAVTMVSSRLTNLSRNATSQAGRFFLFGMISPQDLRSASDLVDYGRRGGDSQFSAQLARLAQGEAIHVTHGANHGQVRFRVRRLRTFDSHQFVPIGIEEKRPVKLATIPTKTRKIAMAVLFPATLTVGTMAATSAQPVRSSEKIVED